MAFCFDKPDGDISVDRADFLGRIDGVNVWKRDGERAPHKPLLLLTALSKIQSGHGRLVAWNDIEEPLRKLLDEFGPSRHSHHPEYPFWYLQSDELWEVEDSEQLGRRKKGGDALGNPLLSELRRLNTRAGLPAHAYTTS